MNIEEFIKKIEDEIEEIKPGLLQPDTIFKENEDWSSMHALVIMALVNTEYDVIITGEDLRRSNTLSDLFNIIKKKKI